MARKVKNEKHVNGNHHAPTVEEDTEASLPSQVIPRSSEATLRNSDMTEPEEMDTSADTAAEGVGSLEILGRGVKELVQAVQDLRHLGVEDLGLPLPKIVVVGDQSTGKSSLIEGMSEIKVPRNTGTCTRCPMEFNLSEGTKWSCKVSICQDFIYTGKLGSSKSGKSVMKGEGATTKKLFGPWTKQDPEELLFATIDLISEVPHVLFLAQLAVLNPGSSPMNYAYTPGKPMPTETYQVKFSPNVIRLDINGPGLPNLSFTDLPGVINVSDVPEETYLVDLVRNLVKRYVEAEDCINLLAIPMSDDPANSTASRLLRDLKADRRTVGCITKPDRFDTKESPDQWVKILSGERFPLGFGYYVIKNNADTRVDHATARAEETAFFNEEEPWTTTLKAHHERFGTHRLQTSLSQLLTAQIQKSLPRIQLKVQNKALDIETELKELPAPIEGNLAAVVAEELARFSMQLQKHIDGGSQMCPFQKDFHALATQFRQGLANSKPILKLRDAGFPPLPTRETPNGSTAGTPCPASKARGPQAASFVIDVSDDEEIPSPPVHRSGNKRANRSNQESPSKMQRIESYTNEQSSKPLIQSKCFTLSEVRNFIQRGYISLPGQVDPKAIEELIRLSMEHWDQPLKEFFAQVKELCGVTISRQVQDVFGHRIDTRYFDEILEVCESFLEEAYTEQLQMASRLLGWELRKPKTLNERNMDLARDAATILLHSQRRKILAEPFLNEQEERNGKRSAGPIRDERLAKVPDSELVPETFGPELKAMAETKAYYEIAFSRFVDNICISMHCELFIKCREKLVPTLKTKFGVLEANANERLARLFAINPEHERRRIVLKKEKATIAQALEQLKALS